MIEPPRVWLTGARSRVLSLKEVVTETIDVSQLQEAAKREVTLSIGTEHVWLEEEQTITVTVPIQPVAADDTASTPPRRGRTG